MKRLIALYIMLICAVTAYTVKADMRADTANNFGHMVTPQGIATGDADNEIFLGGCPNRIRRQANGTAVGGYRCVVKEMPGFYPVTSPSQASSASGIACVLVESNGTTYVSNNWQSRIQITTPELDGVKTCLGEEVESEEDDDEDCGVYDYNDNGIIDGSDFSKTKSLFGATYTYELKCYNGIQT